MSTERPNFPLVCEFIMEDLLELHTQSFREWVGEIGALTAAALRHVAAIYSCDELFNRELFESTIGTTPEGGKPKLRGLSDRNWRAIANDEDLHGLGITIRPMPHVREAPGLDSEIRLLTNWQARTPNWISWSLPARFVPDTNSEWIDRLVAAFKVFGVSAHVRAACLGWMKALTFTSYPLATTDFDTYIWGPAWAMLLGPGHIGGLGGREAVSQNPAFSATEEMTGKREGRSLCYVERVEPLVSLRGPVGNDSAVVPLQPILLPPPFDPAAGLRPKP